VFADSRPPGEWQWRTLAYSLAVATAYARVKDNMHWTSDVVAGAALGIATGRFVSGREDSARRSRVWFYPEPLDKGAMLSFSIDPR
jgi:membrane-associated phospholipid phosphatase